jgi:predicted TIM-barrel fold metal-dependent hydrolase
MPPDAPKEALFALHRLLGFERGVIVQSSCHGTDHAALLDALAGGEGRYRGVALLSARASEHEIERLDAAGVCGVRFHCAPHLGPSPPMDELHAIMRMVEPYGWHIAIHGTGNAILHLSDFIERIRAPAVIDHMGRTDVDEGADGAAFRAVRRLLDRGNVWVKLSGTDRVSREPPAGTRSRWPEFRPHRRRNAFSGAPTGRIPT